MNIKLLREVQGNKEFMNQLEKGKSITHKGYEFTILTCGTFHFIKENPTNEDGQKPMEFVEGTLNNGVMDDKKVFDISDGSVEKRIKINELIGSEHEILELANQLDELEVGEELITDDQYTYRRLK